MTLILILVLVIVLMSPDALGAVKHRQSSYFQYYVRTNASWMFLYVYIYICMYIYIYIYIYTYIYMYVYIHNYTIWFIHVYRYMYMTYDHIYIYIIYTCVYVYIYIYITSHSCCRHSMQRVSLSTDDAAKHCPHNRGHFRLTPANTRRQNTLRRRTAGVHLWYPLYHITYVQPYVTCASALWLSCRQG